MFSNLVRGFREWRALGLPGDRELWENARMVFAEVPVDAETVKDWVPFPLRLARPARASVFIADYPTTTFGCVYHEAAILLHVKLFGLFPMVYCPWMIVDDDRALILGRELLGYPKKMGHFRFEESDGRFVGTLERKGREVLRIEGTIGEPLARPKPGIGRWAVNARHLLGFLPGHLLVLHPRETVHGAHALQATVKLTSTPDDPVGIATGPAVEASIRTCDIGARMVPPPLRVWPIGAGFQAKMMRLRVY